MTFEELEFLDAYAMLAMHALIAKNPPVIIEGEVSDDLPAEIAIGAFEYAEAMLAERKDRIDTEASYEADNADTVQESIEEILL